MVQGGLTQPELHSSRDATGKRLLKRHLKAHAGTLLCADGVVQCPRLPLRKSLLHQHASSCRSLALACVSLYTGHCTILVARDAHTAIHQHEAQHTRAQACKQVLDGPLTALRAACCLHC